MSQQFHYSQQVRLWVLQVIRILSEFQVQYGLDSSGAQLYSNIPVIWGDGSLMAATIQRLNTENIMPSIPMMSVYINNLKYDRNRIQNPKFVDVKTARTRQFDVNSGEYLPGQANAYTVKRMMPAPYKMEVRVDILTSNTQQKLQILEQILPLFNPMLELQSSTNYFDWTSLAYLELTDTIWSNRTIPVGQGADTSYDIATLQFEAPIWLTLPAEVSKLGVIFKVITDLVELDDCKDLLYGTRQVITYNNYGLYVQNNQILVLNQGIDNANSSTLYGQPLNWPAVLGVYGNIRPGVSEIRLTYGDTTSNVLPREIIGTITVSPSDPTILLYNPNIATLPANTLPAITAIINPQEEAPGAGLANASVGQSYLLTGNIGASFPYGTMAANANASINDIITFNGNSWTTIFSASNNIGNIQFVFDNQNSLQYQWNGNAWVNGWEGPYDNSKWRIVI